jgi:hypothetical protein
MASLVAKKKGNKLYYYIVESARVDGQPRMGARHESSCSISFFFLKHKSVRI